MSFTMHGVGVSSGVAIGHAHLVSHALLEVAHYVVPDELLKAEVARFAHAIKTVRHDLDSIRSHLPANAPAEMGAFISTHLMILSDRALSESPKDIILSENCNAEWALKLQMDDLVAQFDEIEDTYLRERKFDVVQVVERVIKVLLGHPGQAALARQEQSIILVAHDLSPADAIQFKQHQFAAFITDVGGATSHTAILARSLNIPSIVALHHARDLIQNGELIIVDGHQGVVIVAPDKDTLAEYRLHQEQWELEQQKLKRLKQTKAVTLDGTVIDLHANIEIPGDVTQLKAVGATGVGLYRTEFLFMNRSEWPAEDEQFEAYRKVAETMKGLPVTIRTLDIGADKQVDPDGTRTCANPALGLRAIRLCLAEPQLFHTQLRAILRASHYGKVKILIPMLCNQAELRQTLHLIDRAKQSLRDDALPFDELVPVGGMIEIPAAALAAETFARRLDFLSIGTNDLIQYTLAIDRTDDTVAHLYQPLHPAVLQLIEMTIRAANKAGKPVSVCGEMAGDARLTRLLLGFGLRQFSMHPANILAVKRQVLQTSLPRLGIMVRKILGSTDAENIEPLLVKLNA
ncbi:MAG TPA: phosphoenolpyruvate--protein phosphotransferase [Novimethylophilus sp.]|jgi:phosphotransferase system enzyme I (PtsI)|uniref:phosphoenolpyruvate--protein phosphotransferase n=1 Tax=Novimethylophilus sp. TaxID=2137426 RepID=UPI002F4266D5